MANFIPLRHYAALRGCALRAVQRAIEDGRIGPDAVRRNEQGRLTGVNPQLADEQWAARTDPVQAARAGRINLPPTNTPPEKGGAGNSSSPSGGLLIGALDEAETGATEVVRSDSPGARVPDAASSGPGAPAAGQGNRSEESDPHGYHEHRAAREKADAALANLRLQEKLGQVCSVADVRRAQFEAARLVQTSMLRIPGRVAALLAAETDPLKIEGLLDREIRTELNGLADRAGERAAA